MKPFLALLPTIFFTQLCIAGPSFRGGTDGCIAPPYEYECVVKTDPEGAFEASYRFTNRDQAEAKGTSRVEIAMCGNSQSKGEPQLAAWLTLHSLRHGDVSASSQIEVPLKQRTFSLFVDLSEGDMSGAASYYFATCRKIR